MRPLTLHTDADEIVRRMPINLETGGEMIPAMPVELAARALGTPLGRRDDGTATLGGRIIPSNVANTFGLNFEGGGQDIPTYSLADLKACADQGRSDFFRREFDGRVVLIGTVLDIEDRKVTSKRFSTGLEGSNALRCALPKPGASAKFERDSIAGVYIHATAVNNLMRGDTLIELPRGWQWAGLAAVGVATAGGALILSPAGAALTLAGLLLTWTGVAVLAFAHGLVLPLTDTAATGVSVLLMTIG